MKMTASFRVVKGCVAEWEPAPVDLARGAVTGMGGEELLKVHVKPPRKEQHESPVSPPACRGPWTKEEDTRLHHAVKQVTSTGSFFRWKSVAALVETRDARQCSYRWANYLSPKTMHTTPPRTRKQQSVADPLKSMMDECMHILGDDSQEVEMAHEFSVALGEDALEDMVTPQAVLGVCDQEKRQSDSMPIGKRRLDFGSRPEDCDTGNKDKQVTSSIQVESLLENLGCDPEPTKRPKFQIRMVPKVRYKGAERKAVVHLVHAFDDRHRLVGSANGVNHSFDRINVAYLFGAIAAGVTAREA